MPQHRILRILVSLLFLCALTIEPYESCALEYELKMDSVGDLMPKGAIARLGSIRWRHKAEVALARFSPDGKILATAGRPETIRLWDVETGKQLIALTDTGLWAIYGVQFSLDSKKLISVQQSGIIRLWDLTTGKQVCLEQRHPGEAYERYGLALSPDGKTIATVGKTEVRLWDAATLKPVQTFSIEDPKAKQAPGVAFSPNGHLLAASGNNDIHLWDLRSGKIHLTIPAAHADGVTSLVFTTDSESLISGGMARQPGQSYSGLSLWDVSTGERTASLVANSSDSGLFSLALSKDGSTLVSGHHNAARVWDLSTQTLLQSIERDYSIRGGYPCAVDISPDGKTVAARIESHAVGLWNVETGNLTQSTDTHRRSVTSIDGSIDGKLLVSSADQAAIKIWDLGNGEPYSSQQVDGRGNNFSAIAIAPNGKTVVAGGGYRLMSGGNNKIQFKGQLLTGDLLTASWNGDSAFSDVIGSLAYSPDGTVLAATTHNVSEQTDEALLLIDAETGTLIERLNIPDKEISLVAFSPDGKTMHSVSADKKFRTWDVAEKKILKTVELSGQDDRGIRRAAISADCKRLAASAAFGKRVFVADTETGQQIRTFETPDTLGSILAMTADGRILATAGAPITDTDQRFDERIHLWNIATGEELKTFDPSTDGCVTTLRFLADGKTLASGMDRGTILLWDVSDALK